MADLKLQIVLNAMGNARQRFEEVTNAGSHLTRQLRETQAESKKLATAQKNFDKFAESRRKLQQLGSELGDTQNAIRQLTQEISRSGVPTREQAQRLQELQRRGRELSQQQQQTRQSSESLRRSLTEAGIGTRNLGQAQSELRRRQEQANQTIEEQRRRLERLNQAQSRYSRAQSRASSLSSAAGSAAIKGTVTMAAMSVPVRAYAESETASTDLRVAMMNSSGKVPPEYKQLDQLATKLGDRLPGTTADFKNLMTMLMRQGLSAQAVLGGTGEAAALLAVQLKQTPEAAAEMAAKLQDATRGTEAEMLSIMDSVQRMFYSGVDVENIVPAFGKLAPALDILKVKGDAAMKQFSPLLAMLDQAGLSGESAGNALRKVFQSSMDTDKIAKATKGSGIDLNFTDGKGEFAGMENMYKELAKMKNLTTEARLSILKDIWGDDAETLQALNTMIEKGQAGYDEFAQKMAAQASLNQRVNEQLGTLTNLLDAATGSFTNLMASMGESIAPELKSITEWISNINSHMSNWAANNPQLAAAIMKTIAAIGVLFLAFAGIAAVVATVLGPFAFLRLALVQVGPLFAGAGGAIAKLLPLLNWLKMGLLMVGRFFMANPIVLGIMLVVGALYLLWKHWDTVKAAIVSGWQWIESVFSKNPILNALFPIIGIARLIINNWDAIKSAVVNGWNDMPGLLSSAWEGIKNGFNAALDGIANAIAGAWAWIQQTFANNPILNFIFPIIGIARLIINNWGVIAPFFQELWAKVVNYAVSRILMFANFINTHWTLIKNFTMAAWSAIKNTVQNHVTAVLAVVLRIWNAIYTATMAIWNPIKAWLLNAWSSIKTAVITFATAILMFIINTWAKIYGTTVAMWANIKAAVIAAWNALINWVRSTSAYQAIVNQWNNITTYLGGLKDTLFNLGARIIGGLIDGIASKFAALKSKWNTVASIFNGSYKGTASANAAASVGASLPGFSTGGYTGNGGRNAIAGIVHRGEGVFNQSEIRAIGGESGFNRLRGLIRTWGSRGIEMLASGGLGQVKTGGLINRSLALLDNGQKQERPKFRDAISVNAAMATAGNVTPAAASAGDFNISITINGGSDNAETIAATIERKFREIKAGFDRQNKTSLWDRD
ncbi:phage tail tape measure protein [Vitreoscilla massiliensis]|uniref:Phage tail tape measure protein n=1 Tax=Vitreoscilla massiliensis TaxID=1689272 RepID=A0ABY4E4P5_9NEIS|nr:phage tail tape measure protein [Vitreoscilla massiliensis]UOO90274.1 phage tail tape measure protein [Vitreoscilla massiliensis]